MLTLGSPSAGAWPADLSQRIARDALKLVPQSLAELFLVNEGDIFAEARTSSSRVLSMVYLDLPTGRLTTPTKLALGEELSERAQALQGEHFRSAVVALGAMYRVAVDLADPGVGSRLGNDARAEAIRREFYSFVAANRDKIPLVIVEPDSLRITLDAVPAFLGEVVAKASTQSAMLRAEGQEEGRVVPSAEIDFRSPVFAVASTAYSRSVSVVAATWIAIWRSAGGDMSRQKPPQIINPRPSEPNPGE